MLKKLKAAWAALFADDSAAIRKELITALRRTVELERRLKSKPVDLVRLPTDETMPQYLGALEMMYENDWIRAFFIMRERELLTKFKDGGEGETLRGALVCLDDVMSSLEDAAAQSKALKAKDKDGE